jgi:hypothetical protein
MEVSFMANRWAAIWTAVVLTFALVVLVFLIQEGGSELFFSTVVSYYGVLLVALIVLYYYKNGLWYVFVLLLVATVSLGRSIYNNPDVVEVIIKDRSLHTTLLYTIAALSLDYYRILAVPQISLTDRKLFLNFGKTGVNWQDITEIRLNQGCLEVEKRKKKISFPTEESVSSIGNQHGFITQLTKYCYERDIPFTLTPLAIG